MGNKCCSVEDGKATQSDIVMKRASVTSQGVFLKTEHELKAMYKEGSKIGDSNVISVTSNENGVQFVMRKFSRKDITFSTEPLENHLNELIQLRHPHACQLIDVFSGKENICLVYEKASGKPLLDLLKTGKVKEEEAKDYARQLFMVLNLSHERQIVHGNIKHRTILTGEADSDTQYKHIKLCDLGQSFVLRKRNYAAKSYEFVSPEITWDMEFTGASNILDCAYFPDLWSIGIFLYFILSGIMPFPDSLTIDIQRQEIPRGHIDYLPLKNKKISEDCIDFIQNLLKLNGVFRMTAARAFQHPWAAIERVKISKKLREKIIRNLHENNSAGQMKRLVLRMVGDLIPKDEFKSAADAFGSLDKNGDGVLTIKEVAQGIAKHESLEEELGDKIEELFILIDMDGSGTINASEFVSATLDQSKHLNDQMLYAVFSIFDSLGEEQNGKINEAKIEKAVHDYSGLIVQEQVDELVVQIMEELATEEIDFYRFAFMMKKEKSSAIENVKFNVCRVMDGFGCDCLSLKNNNVSLEHAQNRIQTGRQGGVSPKGSRRKGKKYQESTSDGEPKKKKKKKKS